MSDNLISRKELKGILAPSENFKRLSEDEQLYIIYEKLQSLEDLYLEEKNLFSHDNYLVSPRQVVVLDNMMEQSNCEDYIGAYYSLLAFLEDDGEEHTDQVYLQELDELYLEIKKLILLIEQSVNFEETFSKLVEDLSVDSMIQFSFLDATTTFNDSKKNISLNGEFLNISWQNEEYNFYDNEVISQLKEVIIQYRKELYDFSKRQEKEIGDFSSSRYHGEIPTDECFGAIDGIMFSVSNQFEQEELNDFYSNFKISLYHVVDEIISGTEEIVSKTESTFEEQSFIATVDTSNEPVVLEEPYDDKKQKKIIAEMLDISLEDAYQNSQRFHEMDAVYYWNPEGSSVVIDTNLDYLLTNHHVEKVENLLSAYRELKRETFPENAIPMDNDTDINDLTKNMIDEINNDYQKDRSIDNVFDFADSLITENDLDVFWKRVSADTLGYIIVKELEENNYLDMEKLKQEVSSFSDFVSICVDTELQSKNKQIVNISTMTKQAPEKTLKTIYDIVCSSLGIPVVEIEEMKEEVVEAVDEGLMEYTISSDTYFDFVITLPARFETLTKNSESSFKIGEVNIMIAKCLSFEKLGERANQWLENSATTNSQVMLRELDREYYIGDRNLIVLEKQLEKNGKRRVYKFIYYNGAMLIFAYSAQSEGLSDVIDAAIESIQILERIPEAVYQVEEVNIQENIRKLRVEHIPFHANYGKAEDLKNLDPIIQEYFLDEDLELNLEGFRIKVLEITDFYVKVRIYDNQGVMIANNNIDFKVDYQVGDCVGNIRYNEPIQLYRNVMDAGESWNLTFE